MITNMKYGASASAKRMSLVCKCDGSALLHPSRCRLLFHYMSLGILYMFLR